MRLDKVMLVNATVTINGIAKMQATQTQIEKIIRSEVFSNITLESK